MAMMDVLALVSRWIHIGAAITAIGGAVFFRVALLPAMRSGLSDDVREGFRAEVARRWKMVVHVCVALLLVTGGMNFAMAAVVDKVSPMPYHPLFLVKVLSALGVFFFAIALSGSSPGFAKYRENAGKWLSVVVVLGVVIVVVSGVMKTLHQGHLIEAAKAAGGG
jgi:hypothetical protein